MTRIERRHRIYDHYTLLVRDIRLWSVITIFPEIYHFVGLPAIVPLWKPVDADISEQALTKAYPIFRQALLQYQKDVRIKAIRTIIAANREVKLSNLSKDPSNYPSTIYDSDFFALATSQFAYWENRSISVSAFPEVLQAENRRSQRYLQTDLKQVRLVRSMLVQAQLDPSTATWQELVQLGECFIWINSPFKGKRRKIVYDCRSLVSLHSLAFYSLAELIIASNCSQLDNVIRRGPSVAKVKAGQFVEIGIKQDESDGEGEGSGSDDSSEGEESSDEEEEEEEEEKEEGEEGESDEEV